MLYDLPIISLDFGIAVSFPLQIPAFLSETTLLSILQAICSKCFCISKASFMQKMIKAFCCSTCSNILPITALRGRLLSFSQSLFQRSNNYFFLYCSSVIHFPRFVSLSSLPLTSRAVADTITSTKHLYRG